MKRRLWFGHPVNIYNTELEARLLRKISEAFPDWEIENPNQETHQEEYRRWKDRTGNGMDYFIRVILPNCQGGVFLPFRDGAWGAGVFKEAKFLADNGCPLWMITADGALVTVTLSAVHALSVDETRARIRTNAGETIPY